MDMLGECSTSHVLPLKYEHNKMTSHGVSTPAKFRLKAAAMTQTVFSCQLSSKLP